MNQNLWVPLHVHSQYSILDALASVEDIAKKSREYGLSACAITDHGNLYGAVEFYKACKAESVKPLIGCEVYVAPESRHEKKKGYGERAAYHLTLIAKNQIGYNNLCVLTSKGFLEGFYYYPRIDLDLLSKHSEGLICLSGCLQSKIAEKALTGDVAALQESIDWYRNLFGEDYYLELMRHPMSEEAIRQDGMHLEGWLQQQYRDFIAKETKVNEALVDLGRKMGIPLVATNDSHYISREDWRAHEVLLNIQSGEPCEIWEKDAYGNPKCKVPNPKRRTYASHEYDFKSPAQMAALFQDIPEALANTLEIAEKCSLELDFKSKHYPVFIPPAMQGTRFTKEEQAKAAEEFLWDLCRKGIPQRYTADRLAKVAELFPGQDPQKVVEDRLQYEMSVIVPKGMSDYLLIVWDFIHWAKTNKIPMGPGRGSGAGSIVLYLIGVTDIEPLRFHLFFERFINPERISYPDIDVDICMDRRGEVIQYVLEKYGRDNIAQIITFGTMKAKMTIKDVGRALDVPLSKVNAIAKLVPDDLNITLEKALEKDPELMALVETDEEAHKIMEIGKVLEGSIRSTGIHAAGVIISGEPLLNFIPVCVAKDSDMPVTQYSMKPVEAVGMLKMDFLGLKTLTAIQKACDQIKKTSGVDIDWVNLSLDDKPTFDLLNQGKTLGIFQLESGGMQDLARNLHLDRFEEIIAVGALYRPGPMDMIPSFINRKHGREPIENDHPLMQEILAETYGIMVYQEQVMQIASKLAGYSLGEGDVLRRAMGKKDLEQMMKERQKFREGALKNGIDESLSMMIFDKIEKFASYGFNKSHAAAYGYLSYVTAYLKANYPKEWMAALMTCDSHDLTKVAKFIREAHAMDIRILPPDVNEAGTTFLASPKGIRFAISGIKGVGEGVVESILTEREKAGPFADLDDFLKRVDTKRVGKKAVESLIEAGCFDYTHWSRDALKIALDSLYEQASADQKEAKQGYLSLFSLMDEPQKQTKKAAPAVPNPRPKELLLFKEKELLGFFLTGHPMDAYKEVLERLSCASLSSALELPHDAVFRTAFLIESVQVRISAKTQKKFAILMISDGYVSLELPIWSELYEEKSALLKENQLIYSVLQIDKREEEAPKISCRWFDDLTIASEEMMQQCDLAFDKAKQQVKRMQFAKTSAAAKPKAAEADKPAPPQKPHSVKLDLEKVRLSHLVELKALFEDHRGSTPMNLSFFQAGQPFAELHIDKQWGINVTSAFEKQLSAFLEKL
jgi:DNA polymerase-3 subunit alpha